MKSHNQWYYVEKVSPLQLMNPRTETLLISDQENRNWSDPRKRQKMSLIVIIPAENIPVKISWDSKLSFDTKYNQWNLVRLIFIEYIFSIVFDCRLTNIITELRVSLWERLVKWLIIGLYLLYYQGKLYLSKTVYCWKLFQNKV